MKKNNQNNMQNTLYKKFIFFLIKIAYVIPLPKSIKSLINYETFSYLFVGVMTTIVNYLTYYICRNLFNIDVSHSTIISWAVAVTFAYLPNKVFVYLNKNYNYLIICKEFVTFVVSRLFSGFCEWFLMMVMVSGLNINDYISKITVSVIVVIMNYITGKIIVFRKHEGLLRSNK